MTDNINNCIPEVLQEFDLNIRLLSDSSHPEIKSIWVVTSNKYKGLYLANADLDKALCCVPEAIRLLNAATGGGDE